MIAEIKMGMENSPEYDPTKELAELIKRAKEVKWGLLEEEAQLVWMYLEQGASLEQAGTTQEEIDELMLKGEIDDVGESLENIKAAIGGDLSKAFYGIEPEYILIFFTEHQERAEKDLKITKAAVEKLVHDIRVLQVILNVKKAHDALSEWQSGHKKAFSISTNARMALHYFEKSGLSEDEIGISIEELKKLAVFNDAEV